MGKGKRGEGGKNRKGRKEEMKNHEFSIFLPRREALIGIVKRREGGGMGTGRII